MIAEPDLRVTADSVDPDYDEPFIEVDEQRSEPVPQCYVHGGFKGTPARFSFYFPPQAQYRGRFAVLRVASQRDGDMQTPYARVQNIARVRVVS